VKFFYIGTNCLQVQINFFIVYFSVAQTEKMMRQARNNLQNRNQEDDDFE
jgi:hypothetical protein